MKQEKIKHNINYVEAIPFIALHLACLLVFVTGVTTTSVILAVALYFVRMWAVTAGYHRYFSHKSFKTSRVFQFILAFLAQTSLQRGVLKWANHHRLHHKHSDAADDVHSPRRHGFWYSHIGWVFDEQTMYLPYEVKDLQKYPELVWIDKHKFLPAILLAILCYVIAGWSGVVVGFLISTIFVFHGTFFINSLTHVFGSQRYLTSDDSRNNFWTALITLGEGWHNNHHYYQTSVRQGFYWWEVDITYYTLKVLSWFRIVWDLHTPSEKVRNHGRKLLPYQIENLRKIVTGSGIDTETLRPLFLHLQEASNQAEAKQSLAAISDTLTQMRSVLKTLPPKAGLVLAEHLAVLFELVKKAQQAPEQALTVVASQMLAALDDWPVFAQTVKAQKIISSSSSQSNDDEPVNKPVVA